MESEATNPSLDLNEERAGAPIGKDPKRTGRDDKVSRMGTASIPRLIVEFAIPSILGMLVNGAYNVIDSVFLGQAMGEIGLATATVAMPIMTVFMAIAMLVGNGGNALAALRMGEGNRVEAERSLGNTVCLSLVFAVIVAVLMHIPACVNALLGVSGATAEDWEYARSFIQIISLGFVFQCIGMGVNNFIRTAGAPNRALGTMIIGAVSCTVFNFLFVMVLGLGCFAPSLMLLALFFSWWWVRRFGFTPWDRKLGTTDVLNDSLTLRKVVMTLVLVILCLQVMYVLLIPWLPEMEAYMGASGQM